MILSFLFFLASHLQPEKVAPIQKFSWLTGTWKCESKQVFETWVIASDTSMRAISYHLDDDGERIIDEIIQLIYQNHQYYYIPALSYLDKQKPVEFLITRYNQNSFSAANKAHDFPQLITYQKKGANAMTATIAGRENNKKEKVVFNFLKHN